MPQEDDRQLNPDWVEPEDGEIVSILMTSEGSKKGIYRKATGKVEWTPYTFDDVFEPID